MVSVLLAPTTESGSYLTLTKAPETVGPSLEWTLHNSNLHNPNFTQFTM